MAGMGANRAENDVKEPISDPLAVTTGREPSFALPEIANLEDKFPDLEIGALLGQGGMGAVFQARQKRLDRQVALKIIRPDAARDQSFAERFTREARTLAKLNHPNIVSVYDFGDIEYLAEDGSSTKVFYFLMEYVDGANLRQILQAGDLEPDRALKIIRQICDALQFAHDEGIVHRDIKPENILIDTRGRLKIADFGLAKLLSEDAHDFTLTGSHQVMGTPRYMAPEQMEGARAVDHRADIYSLGVVFYEMLTGELPLGRFDPPSRKSELDEQWDQVVLRALEKEPNNRYQNASDVKSEVQRVSEYVPGEGGEAATLTDGAEPQETMPSYGLLTMGSIMIGLGFPLLAISLLQLVHFVFIWIGLGISLGGAGLYALSPNEDVRLPANAKVHPGMIVFSGLMSIIGFAMLISIPVTGMGFQNFHPNNAFVWVGGGLVLGGAAGTLIAWEAERHNH